mmetsp:Transcript_44120/g.81551  ORF Transcript_44120/g.81551 Transcript_44120/m.81551 type:complete len:224 (+) Transcript_44120:1744-2415(+)
MLASVVSAPGTASAGDFWGGVGFNCLSEASSPSCAFSAVEHAFTSTPLSESGTISLCPNEDDDDELNVLSLEEGPKLPRARVADLTADLLLACLVADLAGVSFVLSIFLPPLRNFPKTFPFFLAVGSSEIGVDTAEPPGTACIGERMRGSTAVSAAAVAEAAAALVETGAGWLRRISSTIALYRRSRTTSVLPAAGSPRALRSFCISRKESLSTAVRAASISG